jgi:hypothetical protein
LGDNALVTEWPALPYDEWRATRDTLHMYAQVIGKLRLAFSPFEPQWGNVPFYVTARGLTTSPMPVGARAVEAEFDLLSHELVLRTSTGEVRRRPLGGDVADFYEDVMRMLRAWDVDVSIWPVPTEVSGPIPFPDDRTHNTYNGDQASHFFHVLSRVDLVLKQHRARFRGRTSPVEFFWGTFDLALMRYSGRSVDPPAGAGLIERVSGDAEVICAGWWPGDERNPYPAFFAYAYPAPEGIDGISIEPASAAWIPELREFLLPYEDARTARDPHRAILDFLRTTYDGAAKLLRMDEALVHVPATAPSREH